MQSRQGNLHSGITRVGYDANNQPDSVTLSTGESIRYYYDGMGNRLGTDEYTAFMPVYLQGAANTLTDDDDREVLRRRYCGNFIYEDGILQRVLVEGGFITFSNGIAEGMQKGLQKGILSTALRLKQMGMTTQMISEATGLSEEEIAAL